ncbi:MAG: MarR family winged helix-turn-helix transcriptional regulator [Spirosomataceae bacterium]
MKKEQQFKELVESWEKLSEEYPDLEVEAFCLHYLAQKRKVHLTPSSIGMSTDAKLSGLCGRLAKYATYYSKRALEPHEIRSIEDWVYLARLMQMGSPTKSELIVEMVSEFPSGIDVIKRLIKNGWVEEYPDEFDRRSKRVRVTESGRNLLFSTFQRMEDVSKVAFQPLDTLEKELLFLILHKLDTFHQQTHPQVRQFSHEDACTFFENIQESDGVNNR